MFFCRSTLTQSVVVQPNRLLTDQHTSIYIHTSVRPPPLFSTVESSGPRSAPRTSERACQVDTRSQQRSLHDNVRSGKYLQRSYQCFCPRELPGQCGSTKISPMLKSCDRNPKCFNSMEPGDALLYDHEHNHQNLILVRENNVIEYPMLIYTCKRLANPQMAEYIILEMRRIEKYPWAYKLSSPLIYALNLWMVVYNWQCLWDLRGRAKPQNSRIWTRRMHLCISVIHLRRSWILLFRRHE